MDGELLTFFKGYTPEVLIIAFGAFILTNLVKKPIKKATKNLNENVRELFNVVIMFIPLILSLLATIFYSGVTSNEWVSLKIIDDAITSWLLSLTLYAVVSKVLILLVGIKTGTIDSKKSKKILEDITETVKIVDKISNKDDSELKDIENKIKTLISSRDLLLKDSDNLDLSKISMLNQEIKELKDKEKELKNKTNI